MISVQSVQEKIKLVPAVSDAMTTAIEEWYNLYTNAKYFDEDNNPIKTMNLAFTIADEKAMLATLEMQAEVFEPTTETADTAEDEEVNENTRAYYINEQFKKVKNNIRHEIVPAIAMGTMVIKPIVNTENGAIIFDYVLANEFYPISFNENGKLIHGVFIEQITKKDVTYTRLETHELKKGTITIKNEAFKTQNTSNDLGVNISLTDVAEWANLESNVQITSTNGVQLDRLLVATFIMPGANNIDLHTKMGASGYAQAVSLIKDANEVYTSLLWEMRGGEMAIDAGRDTLKEKVDNKGKIIATIPKHDQRLFRQVNVSNSSGDDLYNVFAPALRDISYTSVLNTILNKIEDKVYLARGTLSQADAIERTATEMRMIKQTSFQSNKDIQDTLENVFEDLIYIIDIYATLYNLAPQGEYKTNYKWDDSILTDIDTELKQKQGMASSGILKPEEVAAWYKEETLEERFKFIQEYNKMKQQYDPVPEEETVQF